MATLHTLLRSAAKPEARALYTGLRAMSAEAPRPPKPASPSKPAPPPATPQYSSAATPPAPPQPVGPGAEKSGAYPNTEYFTYNKMSYYDLEEEMVKDRLAQPVADNGFF